MTEQNVLFDEDSHPYLATRLGKGVMPKISDETKDGIIRELLEMVIGENADREGLAETPKRVRKAWEAWTEGYHMSPSEILKTFEDGAEKATEMVIVKDIPFFSHCEHHMAPFFGNVTVGYVPNGRIVGLSKLGRLSNCFAKRLQVQERYTNQIADAIMEHLQPRFVAVIAKGRHMCMESRGVCQQGHHTITQAFRYSEHEMDKLCQESVWRAEFLSLAQ